MTRKKLGELLVDSGVVSNDDVRMALGNQKTWGSGQRLGQVLVSMGKATQKQVARALSTQFDVPFVELPQIPSSVSMLVPLDFQTEHGLVPFRLEVDGKLERLHVAVSDPSNLEPVDELRFQLGKPMRLFVAAKDDIDEVLAALRGDSVAEIDPLEIDEDGSEMILERGSDQVPQGWFASAPGADPFEQPARPVSTPTAPAPVAASSAPLPPEWDIFEEAPVSESASAPKPASAKPAGPVPPTPPPTSMASSSDLDDLLGSVTAAAPPIEEVQPLTRPALPPPPTTKAATVVKFDPPPRSTPSGGTPVLTAVPPVPPGATTSAAPPSNLSAPTPVLSAVPPPPSIASVSPASDAGATPPPRAPAAMPVVAQSQIEISEEDLAILENLERMALGDEPTLESAKVKPAQMVASLIRLLMKKGVIGEAEFLEELGRK